MCITSYLSLLSSLFLSVTSFSSSSTPIRIIYEEGQYPQELVATIQQFTEVQPIPYSVRMAPALAAAKSAPTIVVLQPAEGSSDTQWYRSLFGYTSFYVLRMDGAQQVAELPPSWETLNSPSLLQAVAANRLVR